MENREVITSLIKTYLVGKTIGQVSLSMINAHYLEYEEGRVWVSDGGLEIEAGGEKYAFSFHDESGNFSCQPMPLDELMEGFDHYEVDLSESEAVAGVMGAEIQDVEVLWSGFEVTDYDGSVLEKVDVPVEFLLCLNNGSCIQLSTIHSSLDPETMKFKEVVYDIEGNLLVSFGEKIDILL